MGCGELGHGVLRPAIVGRVLGIVYRRIATHLIKTADTGSVISIQRFRSALNIYIILFLGRAYRDGRSGARFQWVKASTSNDRLQYKLPLTFTW